MLNWEKVKSKIFSLQQPLTVFNWRFFVPNPPPHIKLHRHVFLNLFQDYFLPFRVSAIAYAYAKWWLYLSWRDIYVSYKYYGQDCFAQTGISKQRQLLALFHLSFGYCIPPSNYYQLSLFRWKPSGWLKFVYDFQAPMWHMCYMSARPHRKEAKSNWQLLQQKDQLTALLQQHNIPSVDTLKRISAGQAIRSKELNDLPANLFFKPTDLNKARGCFYLEQLENAELKITQYREFPDHSTITINELNRLIEPRDYILQPHLRNHPSIDQLLQTQRCTVFRVITWCLNSTPCALAIYAFVPIKNYEKELTSVIEVDVNTGIIMTPNNPNLENNEYQALVSRTQDTVCPNSKEMISACVEAHRLLDNLTTIGWDVIISNQGIKIIEGNRAWGSEIIQASLRKPLLTGQYGTLLSRKFDAFS